MRRRVTQSLIGLALAAPALLAGCGQGAGLDRLAAGEHGKVAQVTGGDVLTLDSGLVVRLAGLEAPRDGQPGADESRAALARIVQGRAVQLYYGGARRDPIGRALAQVRLVGGGWVEAQMLAAGEAQVRTFADNRAMVRPMLDDEARARLARRGLWRAGGAFQVRLPQEVGPGPASFQIVEGRVRRVTDTRRGVYLDFNDQRQGFAAQIPDMDVADLNAAGLSPTRLAGRLVRLRGTVGWNGVMQIDHPEQIEMLDAK